jgi:hypothetical protein
MEKLCRVIKFSIRTAAGHIAPQLPSILGTLSEWFDAQPHSCFLYVVHVCTSKLAHHSPQVDEAVVGEPRVRPCSLPRGHSCPSPGVRPRLATLLARSPRLSLAGPGALGSQQSTVRAHGAALRARCL